MEGNLQLIDQPDGRDTRHAVSVSWEGEGNETDRGVGAPRTPENSSQSRSRSMGKSLGRLGD